jgi:hypothetical protein
MRLIPSIQATSEAKSRSETGLDKGMLHAGGSGVKAARASQARDAD